MEVFIENLKGLIAESNKSLRQLASESGVSAMQYSRYLSGSIPTIGVTIKIANYFNCSLDYLFGLSDEEENNKYTTFNFDINLFIENYNELLKQNNTTNYKFMKQGGYDESIIRHWKGGSLPRLDVVYYIAKNLGGSMDKLLGRRESN